MVSSLQINSMMILAIESENMNPLLQAFYQIVASLYFKKAVSHQNGRDSEIQNSLGFGINLEREILEG